MEEIKKDKKYKGNKRITIVKKVHLTFFFWVYCVNKCQSVKIQLKTFSYCQSNTSGQSITVSKLTPITTLNNLQLIYAYI